MSEESLTVVETARKLGVSIRTIQRYCKDGRLNHKWVKGKRHKELRILPPIHIAHLPCGRRKNLAGTFDYITKNEFEEITSELISKLEEKDHRIKILEEETAKLKSVITLSGNSRIISDHITGDEQLRSKIEDFLYEFEKVRPTEKKLILKLAKEVKFIEEKLKSSGMMQSEHINPDTE